MRQVKKRLGRRDGLSTGQQRYAGGKKERRRDQRARGKNRREEQWGRKKRGWEKG